MLPLQRLGPTLAPRAVQGLGLRGGRDGEPPLPRLEHAVVELHDRAGLQPERQEPPEVEGLFRGAPAQGLQEKAEEERVARGRVGEDGPVLRGEEAESRGGW